MREPYYSNEEIEQEKILRKIRRSTLKFKQGDDMFGIIQQQLNIFKTAEKKGFFDQLTTDFIKNWCWEYEFFDGLIPDRIVPESNKIIDDTNFSSHPYAIVFDLPSKGSYEDFAQLTISGKEWLIKQINTLTPIKIVDINFDSENTDNVTDVCVFEFTDQYNVTYCWQKYCDEKPIQRIDFGCAYDFEKLSRDELIIIFGEDDYWLNKYSKEE